MPASEESPALAPGWRLLAFVLSLLPAAFWLQDLYDGVLARPWAAMIRDSGLWSMRFLVLGLCLSPLTQMSGARWANALRRMIGLFGAFYAALHLYVWAREYQFDWGFLLDETLQRPYLAVGVAAALLLVPLAATSPGFMHRALGTIRWRRLHLLMYPVVATAFVHFVLVRGLRRAEVAVDLALLAFCALYRLTRK